MADIETLQKWLKGLNDIPQLKNKKETFMDISGIPHYENIWSNIYAFFFDTQGKHEFGDLFISSLHEIIKEKGYDFDLNDYNIYREFSTQENNRIDLLLSNEDSAIIIEAKVNHLVNNNFSDYWESIKQKKKIGVLLSLRKHPIIKTNNGGFFINITHKELIDKVISKMPNYYLGVNNLYHIYLQDFCQTIYNITNPMDTKIIEFYYQNRTQINQLSALRKEMLNYIINQFENGYLIKNINSNLELYKKQNSKKYVYYKFRKLSDVMLTLIYDRLWSWSEHGCRVDIYLELQGNTLKKIQNDNSEFVNTLTETERQLLTNCRFTKNNYEHYAHLRVDINPENIDELLSLQEKVAHRINESTILDIANKIIQHCQDVKGTNK